MTNKFNPLAKAVIILFFISLAAIFFGSLKYRLGGPDLVKHTGAARSSSMGGGGQSGGMNTGMTEEVQMQISELMQHLREDPNSVEVRMELARFFISLGDWKSALSHLEKTLQLEPDNMNAAYYRGLAYYRLNDLEEAAKTFEALIAKQEEPYSMVSLAIIYAESMGKTEEARDLFRRVANMEGISQDIKNKAQESLLILEQ